MHVYIIYDAVGSLTTAEEFLQGCAAGVSLCPFNPLNPLDVRFAGLNHRDHRKIVVVDGDHAFAGGINFSHAYQIASRQAKRRGFSKQQAIEEGWRDTHVGVRGAAAKHLERLFRETWTAAECPGECSRRSTTRSSMPARQSCRSSRALPKTSATSSTPRCCPCSPMRRRAST